MKYLISLLLTINFLNASMLLDKSTPVCIEDFYYKDSYIFYQQSSNLAWYQTTQDSLASLIFYGYTYDSASGACIPSPAIKMGLTTTEFNFLLGLIGVIFGGVFMFFTIQTFVSVGGRR